MEYLYIAMFLQEIGREINTVNIQKIFAALDMEVDAAKVQFLIPALAILSNANLNKVKTVSETSFFQQLSGLQKRFEALENLMANTDRRPVKPKEVIESEKAVTEPEKAVIEPKHAVIINEALEQSARYVYGVADQGVSDKLGAIGLEGAEVYTIPYQDMCAIVHNCSAEPYKSDDEAVVKDWLFTQQEVLDAVVEKFGVVLPMSFDTIIEGKHGNDTEQTVKDWLEEHYDDFRQKMAGLKNKQEFGVQVILDPEVLSEKLLETDEKLSIKKLEIDSKPGGIAYLERELLKDLLKEKIEERADQYFREFYHMIKKCTDDIVIGKAKKVGGNKQMLMNLSCLVNKDRVTELGTQLEKIEKKDGVSVRFSGPWAPYSFVTPEKGVSTNNDDLFKL